MSTQGVNADRKGPKNLMDLANKAQAYKELLGAKERMAGQTPGSYAQGHAQNTLDDAFEHFAELHRDPTTGEVDTAEMQATMGYLDQHIAKGKGI